VHKKYADIEIPEILPPSDDGVFKTLLTHHSAKPCLRDIIASIIGKLARVLQKPVGKMTGAEMWAVFLAYANDPKHRETLKKIIELKEEIKVAYELLTNISQDPDERAQFRARRKFQMDLQHSLITVFDEGELKGKLEVARNLLANKVPLDVIVQSTGLSLDKIQSLK
jgi:predicted transposase/invertase (TIGR01784 family)